MTRTFDQKTDQLNYQFDHNPNETVKLRNLPLDPVDFPDLHRIALWKLDRIIGITEEALKLLNEIKNKDNLAIDSDLSRRAVTALVNCRGVRFPMASTFLKFIRPDIYPIIDVRAYRAIYGKQTQGHQYTLEIYLAYADKLREIADRTQRPLHEIDEQLYCFDKEHNGRIRR